MGGHFLARRCVLGPLMAALRGGERFLRSAGVSIENGLAGGGVDVRADDGLGAGGWNQLVFV